jgi:hypothetical protein
MPEPSPFRLSDDVVDLLGTGVDVIVATRDARLTPECAVGMGLRVHADRRHVTVFVARALVGPTLSNLEDNGQIAVTFCRPIDHRAVQVKGRCVGVRDGGPADRDVQDTYRGLYAEQLAAFGIPRAITRRFAWWPSVALDVEVHEAFTQTPGPGAGDRIRR